MAGRDDQESLPLSFAADRIINVLSGRLEGKLDASRWLLALLEERPGLLTEADPAADIEALAIKARSRVGDATDLLEVSELRQHASKHAIAAGREVVAPVDVAYAILAAQARASTASGPMKAEPKKAKPSSPAAPHARKSAASKADQRDEETTSARIELLPSSQSRVIRVFVSSTFRDMQEEREELVKRVFPQLRKLCESRGVTWGQIDLRWGITEEQAAEGKVLPICLTEIERCRPFFIGLIGERYGWVPEQIEPQLIERQPWLREHEQCSVTELEIDHGVLLNRQAVNHAFFYLRDPAYTDTLGAQPRQDFLELPSQDEVERFGSEEAERRAAKRRKKLEALKDRIRKSGFPFEDGYADPVALGELVFRDLHAIVDELYPEEAALDPVQRAAAEHDAFARSRAGVYIGRRKYFEAIDGHVAGDGHDRPLVVVGGSGLGKSALLANWALGYSRRHPEECVVMHFIGGSPESADWVSMLRRVMAELAQRLHIDSPIPSNDEGLREAFTSYLYEAGARSPVVLILDALNQLDDRDGAPDLVWLPPRIPRNVRVIVSTLPGRALVELETRGCPTVEVQALDPREREELVVEYLRQDARALSSGHLKRIVRASQTANPLYLRTLLDELRVWGDHETLGERIEHYLTAKTIENLYRLILERLEKDYERDRPGLVADATTLIWAAGGGLSEAELLDLLGSEGRPLPAAYWSPLHLALEQSFVNRNGLIGFSHDFLRRAVAARYLRGEKSKRAAHLRLADYFEARREEPRAVDELPWQLAEGCEWKRLSELLTDLSFLDRLDHKNDSDILRYWAQVEAHSSYRLIEAYRPIIENPEAQNPVGLVELAHLLRTKGYKDKALELHRHVAERARRSDDRIGLARSLVNVAIGLGDARPDDAMATYEEAEGIFRELNDWSGTATCVGGRAGIELQRGRFFRAMELLKETEHIERKLDLSLGLAVTLGNQALVLELRGELDEAASVLKEVARIERKLSNPMALATTHNNQGELLKRQGRLDEAMVLYKESERVFRELGVITQLPDVLRNQAQILREQGRLDEALALCEECERMDRGTGRRSSLALSLAGQASICERRGEFEKELRLQAERASICRDLGLGDGLQAALGRQGLILQGRGELDAAMAMYQEQEQVCRQLGDLSLLFPVLGNQATNYLLRGNLKEAMERLEAVEQICRELDDKKGLAATLVNEANVLYKVGRLKDAVRLIEEAHGLAVDQGLTALATQIAPFRQHLRSQLR